MSTYFKLVLDNPATEGFIMPKGFESNVEIHAWGAGGGSGGGPRGGTGGGGSYAYAEVQINAGDFVEMIIGKPGLSTSSTIGAAGGQGSFLSLNFSGGSGGDGYDGDGDNDGGWAGGGGGSASAVLVNDRRVCVAAGGGGGGGTGDDYATGAAGQAGDDYPAAKSTIWFKVKDKAWSSFMNTYAVWSHPREGTKTYKTDIYFPTTGIYTFQYASDNISSFKIDNGSAVGLLGNTTDSFKNNHSLTDTLGFGYHTIEATIQNTGGPGGWAFRILNPDGSELWNSTLTQTESGLSRNTNGSDGLDGVGGGGGGGGGAYGGKGGTGVGNHQGGGRAGNGGQSYGDIIGSGDLTQAGGKNTEYYPGPNYANANRPGYIVMLFREKFRAWEKTTPLAANVQILKWYGNAFGNIMTVSSSANIYVGMRTNVGNVGGATVTSVWTGNSNVQLSSGNIGTISGNASFYFAPGVGSDWKNLEAAWVKVQQDEDIIQTITYTQNSTFVVPPKVSKLDLELIGGGGAGGYSNRKSSNLVGQQGGGGGGAGAYIKTSLTAAQGVIKGAVFPVVVGQGGANITLLSNSTELRSATGSFLQVGDDPGLDLEAGNWCIEAWVYPLSYAAGPAINCIVSKRANKTDKSPYTIGLLNGKLKTFISQSAFSWDLGLNTGDTVTGGITSSRVVDLNRWTHIAVVRSGNTIKQYIDGVLDGSGTLRFSNTALLSNFADVTIGASSLYDDIGVNGLGYTFDGLITNFRITKGVSVYVNNFTPSKIPLSFSQVAGTNINAISAAQVSLLTCQSGNDHIDGSQYSLIITPIGGPIFSETNPFDIEGLRDGGVSKFGTLIANGGRAGAHAVYEKNTAGVGGIGGTAVVPTGYSGGRNGIAGGNGNAVPNNQITPPGVNPGDASGGKGADSILGTGGAAGIGGDGQGGSATGYGAGGGGAGADAPSVFSTLWNLSNAASYSINYDITVDTYANIANLAQPQNAVTTVATFGSTANANILFDTVLTGGYVAYNRTITSASKINLSQQIGLEYQINKGGNGWGEPPDQTDNDFVYLQYSTNGTTWSIIDTVKPSQLVGNLWITKRITTPSGAKAAGGVYLRFLNSGRAGGQGGGVYSSSISYYAQPNTVASDWTFLHNNLQNYTVEFWFNHPLSTAKSGSTGAPVWNNGNVPGPGMTITFNDSSANPLGSPARSMQLYVYDGAGGYRVWTTAAGVFNVNTWTHFAMVWDTSISAPKFYIGGIEKTLTLYTYNWHGYTTANPPRNIRFGQMSGSLYSLRIVKDKVYTGTFTPSLSPLSVITNTFMLIFQNGTLIDQSINSWVLTNYNLTIVSGEGNLAPRDTWTVTSISNTTDVDTRAAYRGGSGSDGLVKVTYTQTVKGDSIWKLINQIYVKESGAWYPLISNATISTSIGTTRTYRSIQPTTWTVPPGVRKLFVSLVGGGGGGGSVSNAYSNNIKYAGSQGSPGSVIRGNVDVSPGDIVTVGVGGGGGAGSSGQTLFYTAKGTYSYTVPPGITSLWIAAIGAGGGGGGGHFGYLNDDIGSGQDGMSGHYLRGNLDVVPGDVITFEVGQGGRAGSQGRKRAGGLGGVSGNNSRELSGGGGGSSGVIDWSGTGGGGGAATVVKKNGTIVAVAAGGAGGGGGGYEVDTAYWYHIRGVRNWHGFLNQYAIWKRPFIGRHAFHADILFPVTGWYTFNYATDGDLQWRLNNNSYTSVFNGNVANVFTSNSFISSTGVKHLQCKLKNYTETGGWALQILKPNGDELWNTRFGNADVYSLSTPDPNPSMAMTPYVSSGTTFGGNGSVSITNGGGGGGGGGGYPTGGAGGDVNDATIRETVFATSNVQLPRNAYNGYFTRTANAQSSVSSTTVKEHFIRFEGKTIYSSTKPPTDLRYKAGTYRGSQFGVAAGGVAANPPPSVTLTFTANTSWNVPAGVTSISVTVTGAGGGGGGNHLSCGVSNGSSAHGGGKGGGGYVQTSTIVVTPGENLTLTVGQGGAGGLRSNTKNQYYGGTGQTTFVKRSATTLTSAAGGTGGGNGSSGGKGSDGTGGTATNGGTGGIVNSQGAETIGNAGGAGLIIITFTSIITPYGDYLNAYDLKVQEYWGWGGFTGSDGQDYLPAGWETVLDPAIPNEIVFDLDDAANVTLGNGVSLYTYDEVTGRISGIGMDAPGLDGNVAVFGLTGVSPSGEVRTVTSSDRIDLSDYEQLYFEVNMGTTADWGEAPDYNHSEYLQFEYSIDGITWIALDTTWPWWYWNQYDYRYYYNNYYYYQWYYWYYWNYRRNWQNRINPNTWMTKTADLPEAARQIGGVYLRFYERRVGLTTTPRDTWAVTSVYSVGRRAEGSASNGGRGGYRNNWWGGYWRHYWWWWGWGGWWWWYWYSNSGKDGAVYVVPTAGIGAGQAGGSSIGYSGGKGGSSVVDPRFIETTKYHSVSFNGSTRTHLAITDDASLNLQGANWAIEAYIYPTRFDEFDTIVAKRNNSTAEYGPFVIGLRKGKLQTYISQSGTGWTIGANAVPNLANTTTALGGTTLSPLLVLNEWTHVAVVRSGTFIKQFVDGVLVSTNTLTSGNANLMTSNANVTIGSSGSDGQNVFNGYISNFRMTKGRSVYEGNFPVPSSPLAEIQNAGPGPNIGAITGSNVSLLTCQSGVFIDNSTYGHAVYPKHNAKIQALDPFVRSYARQFIVKGVYNNIGAGGGGGGGASAIFVNGNVVAVASGGGGGAGALGNTEKALRSVAYVDGGNVFGGQGTNRLSSGGAGGGGGGGYNGGQGGALVPGNKGGYAGSDGANLIPPGWFEDEDDDKAKNGGRTGQNGINGTVTISYYKP